MTPRRVGIVGLGLIGGSFAKAYKAAGWEVLAWNRTSSTLELALVEAASGCLDDESIPSCELIVLTLYPEASVSWFETHAPLISPETIVIDASGVKASVCEKCFEIAERHGIRFVGAHPMAGTEHSGFAWSRADLFEGAPMVLCPPPMDPVDQLELLDALKRLLEPCGFAKYSVTSPERHDELIAYTSQLAHVVSNAYVKSPTAQSHDGFSAGSYRDLTRVARLNADMWAELFMLNRENLSFELGHLIDELGKYKDALDEGDAEALHALLVEGDRLKREADPQ